MHFLELDCATLFNDDIGLPGFGLFHYFGWSGFARLPTTHYFRPFYEYLYENLGVMSNCLGGQLAAEVYLDITSRYTICLLITIQVSITRPTGSMSFLVHFPHSTDPRKRQSFGIG